MSYLDLGGRFRGWSESERGESAGHFVTDRIERALERAKHAADGQDVMLWGGAQVELEQTRAVEAPGVTHITYKVMT